MSHVGQTHDLHTSDTAPGEQRIPRAEITEQIKSYLIGLGLAVPLTVMSFLISGTTLVWGPSIPVALVVLAIAQMGVHLVFFLHITTGPDSVNNVMALAFGLLIVFLILTGSLWIMANLNRNMGFPKETMPMQVEPGAAARSPIVVRTVTANGVVHPAATTPLSAHVSGQIQAVDCAPKMQVKAGQSCAKIDPRPYQIAVDRTRADLAAAETRLDKDKADLARAKAAFESHEGEAKRQALSRKAIERSRKAFEKVQTQTERDETRAAELQAALHAAEVSLGSTNIVSPIDGTVVSRNVEMGQKVVADSAKPLFLIAAIPTLIQIDAIISAKDSGGVKLGDKATFTVDTLPDHSFSGTVTQIRPSPQTSEPITAIGVVISAPNPDLLLKPGMAATIRIGAE